MRSLSCLLMTNLALSLVYLSVTNCPYSDLILQEDLELFSERFQAFFLLVQSFPIS